MASSPSVRNQQGSGVGNIIRPSAEQRRGNESMGTYYRRTGQTALGARAGATRKINAGPTSGTGRRRTN